jgi:sphingomyelin phosphodiesterase 2
MGDFNALPTSFPYRLLIEHGAMTDSWDQVKGFDVSQTPIDDQLSPEAAINVLGVTCDSPTNSWSKHFLKQSAHKKKYGDRLDYIFYRPSPQMECVKSNVVLTENIPGTEMSYSDHFGVCSVFNVSRNDTKTLQDDSSYSNLSQDVIDGIVATLQSDQVASKKTANFLLRLLTAALFSIIALFVIIIALPTAFRLHDRGDIVTVVVTIVGGLLLTACALGAPVALIVGFVFGHTEQRALLQFLEEIDTLQSVIKASASENDLIQMHDEAQLSTPGRRRSANGQSS